MIRIRWAPVAALVILMLAACTVDGTNENEGTPQPGDAFVIVSLDEFSIELPGSIAAGTVSFEISNSGDMEHSFAIEGPGVQDQLDDSLASNEEFVLTLELEPGTYTVWCPIGNHRDQGMEATLEVSDGPSATGEGAPLNDEGVQGSEEQAPITDDYSAP